jgi:hypothetical protein
MSNKYTYVCVTTPETPILARSLRDRSRPFGHRFLKRGFQQPVTQTNDPDQFYSASHNLLPQLGRVGRWAGEFNNGTNVFLASPIVAISVIPDEARWVLTDRRRR